jgi:hypothetical protein
MGRADASSAWETGNGTKSVAYTMPFANMRSALVRERVHEGCDGMFV